MKKFCILLIVSIIGMACAFSDIHITRKSHSDGYYYGGVNHPASDSTSQTWIGDKIIAVVTSGRIIIVDMNENLMRFINRNDKTYIETSLPVTQEAVLDEQAIAFLKRYPRMGEVKETGETQKIGKWNCICYDVNSWYLVEGSRYRETSTKVWATTEAPVDMQLVECMNTSLQKLGNYDARFIAEYKKIKGYQIASETTTFSRGEVRKSRDDVVSCVESEPPPDAYSVPSGYTKKEKLTMQDLRTR